MIEGNVIKFIKLKRPYIVSNKAVFYIYIISILQIYLVIGFTLVKYKKLYNWICAGNVGMI